MTILNARCSDDPMTASRVGNPASRKLRLSIATNGDHVLSVATTALAHCPSGQALRRGSFPEGKSRQGLENAISWGTAPRGIAISVNSRTVRRRSGSPPSRRQRS